MIATRPFEAGDEAAFLSLYRDCLEHYGIPSAEPETEARLLAMLTDGRHMSCLLAFDGDGGDPAGFATWCLTFPAGRGLALYMKEIFVSSRYRGQHVGSALLSHLLDIAQDEGCTRMDWQTDGSNAASQGFYEKIGAPRFDKLTFRIDAADFARFSRSLSYSGLTRDRPAGDGLRHSAVGRAGRDEPFRRYRCSPHPSCVRHSALAKPKRHV